MIEPLMYGDKSARQEPRPPRTPNIIPLFVGRVLSTREAGRFLGAMDRDKDGKVTVAEANACVKRRTDAARAKGRRPTRSRFQMLRTAKEVQSREKSGEGLWVVSIGHSCVIPAIEPCITISRAEGFPGHTHFMQFYGGASGAAEAQWQHEGERQQARPALATGKIDVMTFGHLVKFDGKMVGGSAQDYERWIEFAMKHNPKIRFYIQDLWPWLPGAEREVDLTKFNLKDYEQAMAVSSQSVNEVVDVLARKYPDRIHVLPAGLAMTELVRRLTNDRLPGVDAILVGQKEKKAGLKVGLYRDKIHPTELVASLQGYIYFACLYQKNPARLKTALYKDESLDRILREVAWKVVTENPRTGVKVE